VAPAFNVGTVLDAPPGLFVNRMKPPEFTETLANLAATTLDSNRAPDATVTALLLLIAAGIEIVQAIMVGKWAGLFQHWLSAALFGVLGALIVWRPVVTAEILTLLIGAFFLVAGIFQLVTPFVISLPEWGWHALNGLITLVLGVLILAQWPVSGLWVIGLFLGIELIFYGGAWIAVALRLRSAS